MPQMQLRCLAPGAFRAPLALRPAHPRGRTAPLRPSASSSNGATPAGGVVTDAAVPEGHRGLHDFLYGEGDAHESDSGGYQFREGEDDGSSLLPVADWLAARGPGRAAGVYALYDTRRALQYVGYSRNTVLAVKGHLARVGEERCAFVRCMVFANAAMRRREALAREADNWLEEAGALPPGNGAERELWEGRFDPSLLSPEQAAEYEEKKLKMRKAMGDTLGGEVEGETPDARERRLRLIQAVEGDDWSGVIDGQTAETVDRAVLRAAAAEAAPAAVQGAAHTGQIVTPFARASVHRAIGEPPAYNSAPGSPWLEGTPPPEGAAAQQAAAPAARGLSVESADAALEEVRPYLIADGGDVEVVEVEDGIVFLRLQGACGTCPSSTATMKMGIERCLRAAFGSQLRDVVQLGGETQAAATVAGVDGHLDSLRPAIAGYGGSVEVLSVEAGAVTLRYGGPRPIAAGIVAAIKDRFPDVGRVALLDADSGQPFTL